MATFLTRLVHQGLVTARRPGRLLKLANAGARRGFLTAQRRTALHGDWEENADFQRRHYPDYESYLDHQKTKLDLVRTTDWMREYEEKFPGILRERIGSSGMIRPGMSVLCLAARLGTEVRAFRDFGCFAVGLDINPGPENKYVVHGDFHDVQFASGSADVVFTNSLDHGLQPEKILREVARVLKPGGLFVVEASGGTEDEAAEPPEEWEAFYWSSVNKLAAFIEGFSFRLVSRQAFTEPNPGEHLVFASDRPGG